MIKAPILQGILLCFCLVFSAQVALAQQNDKVIKIDGKSFKIHTVEKGNTLYSIAKSYGLSVDDVLLENPKARAGVRVGEQLKIPVNKVAENSNLPKIDEENLIHTVEAKETVFSIAKRYEITTSDLVAANPSINNGLKIGDKIKIPSKKAKTESLKYTAPAVPENQKTYRVLKGETLYSLSIRFSVTPDALKNANGGLPEGLKEGQQIFLPENANTTEKPADTRTQLNTNDTRFTSGNPAVQNVGKNDGHYKVALLLPFDTDKLLAVDKLGHEQIALEFYQGALLAIDSIKALGGNMDVFIKDTKKDAATVRSILSKPDMANLDLIIGPMYKSELLALSDLHEGKVAHVVCPVQQSGGLLVNRPYLSNAHCDDASQTKAMAKFVMTTFPRENVLVIRPSATNPEKLGAFFLSAFKAEGGIGTQDYISDLPTLSGMEQYLKAGRNNVVYVGSNQLSYVSGVLSKLNSISNKYDITVIGNEDWIRFDQIDNGIKNKLNLHLPQSYYVDYTSAVVKNFLSKYRELYGTDPNKYAHLGYDVCFYYLKGLMQQGPAFFQTLNQSNQGLTATKFQFQRLNTSSGFDNLGMSIVRYTNYNLEIVR